MKNLDADYKVRRIRGGQHDGLYEITYKGSRIESGGPFVTRKTAIRLMQCAIAEQRNRSQPKPKPFRPRGIESDGLKYYQERNKAGDYVSADPSTLEYYRKLGKNEMEGRATAIQGDVTSVCTTGLSLEWLRNKCRRVRKADIPQKWLNRL